MDIGIFCEAMLVLSWFVRQPWSGVGDEGGGSTDKTSSSFQNFNLVEEDYER